MSALILGQLAVPLSALAKESPINNNAFTEDDTVLENRYTNDNILNIKWVEGDFRAVSAGEDSFGIKALSVITEYEKQVFFTQYGLSKDTDGSTLNVGLGFYHSMPLDIVIGGNVFYDVATGTNSIFNPFCEGVYRRYSAGGAIMTSQAGSVFKIYKGISEAFAGYKASDGYDFGVNGLVPRFESINLGVSKYSFSDVNEGTKFKIEYKPNSLFTLVLEKNQSDTSSASLYIETKYKFNTPLEEQLAISAKIARNV